MAPQIWSAPRLNRKYTWLSLKIFNLVYFQHVWTQRFMSPTWKIYSWNKVNWPWRFGDDSSPRIAVRPRKKNLHRPGVQPPHATVPAATIDLPLPKVTLWTGKMHVFRCESFPNPWQGILYVTWVDGSGFVYPKPWFYLLVL
jgi:hypothetical protein